MTDNIQWSKFAQEILAIHLFLNILTSTHAYKLTSPKYIATYYTYTELSMSQLS